MFEHDTPAVVKRIVSYDGVHPAEEQDFSYSTVGFTYEGAWSTKQTIVTTKDLLSPGTPSFQTIYNYTYWPAYRAIGSHLISPGMGLEHTIIYKDTTGAVVRTVTKAWTSYNQLSAVCTTLPDGKTSGTFYQYQPYSLSGANSNMMNPAAGMTDFPTDIAEYDYGLVTTPCQRPSSTPTKETVTTYATFVNTPLLPTFTVSGQNVSLEPISDRPATIVEYQNGTKASETEYVYDQTAVASVSPTPVGHDENNYENGSNVPRGNLTTVTRKCFQGSTNCTDSVTTIAYDTTGQPVSVTDPCGNAPCSDMTGTNHTTTLSYADNYTTDDGSPSGNTNTYLTKITRPTTTNGVPHVQTFQWDFNKGELRQLIDENNNPTSYQYADPWWRLTQATFPDGGSITKTYTDAGPNPTVKTTTLINTGNSLISTTVMDGMGHVIQTQLNSDTNEGVDYVDTTYDGFGRVATVSNPYRSTSDPTYGITSFSYDSLNRKTVEVETDGSKVQWCFNDIPSSGQTNCSTNASTQTNAEWVDFSDEVGNHWQRTYDSFGRLTSVLEPNGSSQSPSMETDYGYDGLNDLISVVQNGNNASYARDRSFTYNSLAQLTSATNPESGTLTYAFDANGNVGSRTDSRGITTTYMYDVLNRPASKSYSDGTPMAEYYYDQSAPWGTNLSNYVGRLTTEGTWTSAAGWITSGQFNYDSMGRVIGRWNCWSAGSCSNKVAMTYDPTGDLTSETNPAGVTVSYTYDAAQRISGITSSFVDTNHPATLWTGNSTEAYYPNGALRVAMFGNGLYETAAYNKRLQPCRLNVNSTGTYFTTCADATPGGNVEDFSFGFNAGSSDSGNLASFAGVGQQAFNRTYGYDSLNRLISMSDSASNQGCKGLSWTYDAWGNRTAQTVTSGSCFASQVTVNLNNQLSGSPYTHDGAGNMTHDANHSYTYDAENRIIAADGGNTASYVYNAAGERAQKTVAGVATQYHYDASERVLAEYGGGCGLTCWSRGYVYRGTQLEAVYANSTTYFVHPDHLGSTHLMTALDRSVHDSMDYQPYGEQTAGDTGTTHKFTGKERDAESNLDYFGARFYSSSMGRFMSPDPVALSLAPSNPQTWNKYAYTFNRPTVKVDPTGDWPTYFHHQIYEDVLGHMLSHHEMRVLEDASDWVDSSANQAPERSYMHSMRDGAHHQTVQAAEREATGYIAAQLQDAVDAQIAYESHGGKGYADASLRSLAHAMHTATDATSPEHAGYQPWYGMATWSALMHFEREGDSATATDAADTEARYQAEVAAARMWSRYQAMLAAARKKRQQQQHPHKQEQGH